MIAAVSAGDIGSTCAKSVVGFAGQGDVRHAPVRADGEPADVQIIRYIE